MIIEYQKKTFIETKLTKKVKTIWARRAGDNFTSIDSAKPSRRSPSELKGGFGRSFGDGSKAQIEQNNLNPPALQLQIK